MPVIFEDKDSEEESESEDAMDTDQDVEDEQQSGDEYDSENNDDIMSEWSGHGSVVLLKDVHQHKEGNFVFLKFLLRAWKQLSRILVVVRTGEKMVCIHYSFWGSHDINSQKTFYYF